MRIKKVSQTVPTSAQVVDGYSNSTTDSYSCNQVNKLTGIELFYSENGATSGTLSDNYTNYERIEVRAMKGSSNPFCVEGVLYPAKTNRLDMFFVQSDLSSDGDNKTYYSTIRYTFSTNTFSMQTSANWYERKATGVPTSITYDTGEIKIYKIIGYK